LPPPPSLALLARAATGVLDIRELSAFVSEPAVLVIYKIFVSFMRDFRLTSVYVVRLVNK